MNVFAGWYTYNDDEAPQPMPCMKNLYRESSVKKTTERTKWRIWTRFFTPKKNWNRFERVWCLLLGWCRSSIHTHNNVQFLSMVSVKSEFVVNVCLKYVLVFDCLCVYPFHLSSRYFKFDDFECVAFRLCVCWSNSTPYVKIGSINSTN